jgi:hypothetical protein
MSSSTLFPPQYLRPWELSMDPSFDEFVASLPVPTLSQTHLCPVESQFSLSKRIQRRESATLIQSLWRGYKARKSFSERKAAEVASVLPLWASLDEVYRICVVCQSYANILNYAEPSYDPTESLWYIWMLTQGRYLESLELYLLQRGWVRPKETPLNNVKAHGALREVRRYYRPSETPLLSLPRPPSWSYLSTF